MDTQKINDLKKYLIGFAIGIRFRANFSIEDQLGKITDDILYSDGSYFNPSRFPHVQNEVNRKILVNKDTTDNLIIDNSNIILQINSLLPDLGFTLDDIPQVIMAFEKQIINGILKNYKIKEIIRIGYVNRYLFDIDILARNFVGKTIGKTFDGVNDINLTFSKKILNDAALKKNINDYNNAIFNVIKKADRDEIFMSVDYQEIYDPFLSSHSQLEFRRFLESTSKFNESKYLPWLNANYGETE